MKIALLISGRCVRYEVCLLPILEKTKYDVDVFMSINDNECKYYENVRKKLSPWLKGICVKPYEFPDGFLNSHSRSLRQEINGKLVPLHTMSMFYNDMNAYNIAKRYADQNNFEYDNYLKYRADLIADDLPEFKKTDEIKLYSVIARCMFNVPTVDRVKKSLVGSVPCISAAIDYGNRKTMDIYFDTYNFILEINNQWNGNYPINFEDSLTHQIYDKKVPVERFNYKYLIDKNRRMFDQYKTFVNSSGHVRPNYKNSLTPRDMNDVETTENIPPISDLA